MKMRGSTRVLGALAASGAVLFAISVGCEPQDIYLFDEPEVEAQPDAGETDEDPEPDPDPETPVFEAPACESTACEECVDGGDCPDQSMTYCHPVTGECRRPCDPTAGLLCPEGQECHPEIRLCVECVSREDCSDGALPACDAERGVCVECLEATDCTPTGRVCLRQAQRCVQCLDDSHCEGLEEDNVCRTDNNVCVECLNNDQCAARDPTRPICSTSENECEDEED